MKKIIAIGAMLLGMGFSAIANAGQVDFTAKLTNLGASTPANLVGDATFSNFASGDWTIYFTVRDAQTGVILYEDNATIASGQSVVTKGKQSTGKIRLTYDIATDTLNAHFTMDAINPSNPGYAIYVGAPNIFNGGAVVHGNMCPTYCTQ